MKYMGFTDGSSDNAGDRSGGWAFILKCPGFFISTSDYEEDTTNNRMEIKGVLELLEYIDQHFKDADKNISITSDSQYVIKSLSEWRFKWEKQGWKTSSGPVKNMDLWKKLIPLVDKLKPEFIWIKGHSGHLENEKCDELAGKSRKEKIRIEKRIRLQ